MVPYFSQLQKFQKNTVNTETELFLLFKMLYQVGIYGLKVVGPGRKIRNSRTGPADNSNPRTGKISQIWERTRTPLTVRGSLVATTHLGLNLDDNVKNLIAEERNNGNKYPAEKEVKIIRPRSPTSE